MGRETMRRSLEIALALGFALCTPAALGAPGVKGDVDALVRSAPKAKLSVSVVDAESGEQVYGHEATRALVPASNMKLLTTAAALARLGADFAHTTRVALVGPVEDGVLRGDLLVVGGGDPTISLRFDAEPLLDEVAAAVQKAGVRRIDGAVVGDARAFDSVRVHPGWEKSDAEHWYGAEVSGLSLNDGCVDVSVAGGAAGPVVTCKPDTRYVTFDVRAKTLATSKGHVFSLLRTGAHKRVIRVTGKVYARAKAYTKSIPVTEPARFFATVLRERLLARGVGVESDVRLASGDAAAGTVVWERKAPLTRTLTVTNKNSQNLYAECLIKTLGRLDDKNAMHLGGSWKAGAKVVRAYALGTGAKGGEVTVDDGSGLSRGNALSARAIVSVLRAALDAETGAVYLASLAQPGETGTLKRRLTKLPAGVSLHAKTGTLTHVSALSGVLVAGKKRWLFSILSNGPGASRRLLDRIVTVLAGHLAKR